MRISRQPVRKTMRYFTQMPPRSYPAFSLTGFAQQCMVPTAGRRVRRFVLNLSITAVNRKVDGTFTDLTPITGSLG
ncbi:conserved hypothetical protein [Paraburkholderia sacchari]